MVHVRSSCHEEFDAANFSHSEKRSSPWTTCSYIQYLMKISLPTALVNFKTYQWHVNHVMVCNRIVCEWEFYQVYRLYSKVNGRKK